MSHGISIGCDMHKRYSVFAVLDENGEMSAPTRIEHHRDDLEAFLRRFPAGTPVAIETTAHWYWFADLIEQCGLQPRLTNARRAKWMMGHTNKTDRLDAEGLAILQRNGTLPDVFILPAELRDRRELLRARMAYSRMRTQLKNRIHATLAKHAIRIDEVSDIFGKKGRELLAVHQAQLPPHTRSCLQQDLELIDAITERVSSLEQQIEDVLEQTDLSRRLQTAPGIGKILSAVIIGEVGVIERFPGPKQFASYCGTVPTVHSSGGKTWHGRTRKDANRYLKWAYAEAANSIAAQRKRLTGTHVATLYARIRSRKGHSVAAMAVARHLAEATWWMWTRQQEYIDPAQKQTAVQTRVSAKSS